MEKGDENENESATPYNSNIIAIDCAIFSFENESFTCKAKFYSVNLQYHKLLAHIELNFNF